METRVSKGWIITILAFLTKPDNIERANDFYAKGKIPPPPQAEKISIGDLYSSKLGGTSTSVNKEIVPKVSVPKRKGAPTGGPSANIARPSAEKNQSERN